MLNAGASFISANLCLFVSEKNELMLLNKYGTSNSKFLKGYIKIKILFLRISSFKKKKLRSSKQLSKMTE